MEELKGSPYRRRGFDIESGDAGGSGERQDDGDDEFSDSPFDIRSTKNASTERLKRWRQAALVLNASPRFRYTLDLKKEEERKETVRRIRTHAQVIRAAYRFKEVGEKAEAPSKRTPSAPTGEYGVGQEDLLSMSRQRDFSLLQQLGGVAGLCEKLKTDSEKGITGYDEDILARKHAFGSNTYPKLFHDDAAENDSFNFLL